MSALAARGRARAEAQAVDLGVAETVTLSVARGAAFETPPPAGPGRARPARRMSGLDWLAAKGALSPAQYRAGERYGLAWRRANAESSIGSSLDLAPGGGGVETPLSMVMARAEARAAAAARLASYRRTLGDQVALLAACDSVCGREMTPREATGGDREAGRLEAVLVVALDLLGA